MRKSSFLYHAARMRVALITIFFLSPSVAMAQSSLTGLSDTLVHAPPASGPLGYDSSPLASTQGISYLDPVFGTTVRRLTTDHVADDIYATNMKWNADETRYLHRTTNGTPWPDYWEVIDTATGKITHTGIPNGAAISAPDGGFDPADPNALYYYGSNGIHKVTLNSNGTWSDAVYFTPPNNAKLKPLGGTLNWFDSTGRYMLVRYGPEPSVHLYDRQNMAAGPYGNPINGTSYIDVGSYIGITPDGQFLVGYQPGAITTIGKGQGVSWKINHANRTAAAAPNPFWSLCGDHGSFISSSDGHNYMITNDCYANAGLWRVDITNNAKGLSEAQQQALPNNKLLLAYKTWSDFGHYSTAARGPLRDWAFLSTEDGTDTFNSGTSDYNNNISPWHTYRQSINAVNVVTGEIRQLAHHRSRSINNDYYYQPRVSASWGAKYVGFPSNFNQNGVIDIYAVQFSNASGAQNQSPSADSLTPINIATYPGVAQSFTATYSDPNGWQNLSDTTFYITGGVHNQWIQYNPVAKIFTFMGVSGTCTPGQATTLSDGFLTLNCSASSASGSGTKLNVTFSVTPLPSFSGSQHTLLIAASDQAEASNSNNAGNWTVGVGPTVENIIWTNPVNTKITGNSLQKTSGCNGCEDAGATSQQRITSGNGYVEFKASETSNLRFLGLSNGNTGTSAAAIKFAIRLQAGYAEVRESGVYKMHTTFVTGDIFRVAVGSGIVKYYKNGSLFYTSTIAPSYPLLVDTALLNLNATITSAKISH